MRRCRPNPRDGNSTNGWEGAWIFVIYFEFQVTLPWSQDWEVLQLNITLNSEISFGSGAM